MRSNSSKLDEGKSNDDDQVAEILRVAEANQLRLQRLELSVASLTSICNALRSDLCSLGLSNRGSTRKVQMERIETKVPFSRSSCSSLDSKDHDILSIQMQQLVEQAAALGILKEPKNSPVKHSEKMKENPKANTRAGQKNVQATTCQKRCTRSLVQTMKSTTEKKMSMEVGAVKNNGATQPTSDLTNAVNNTEGTNPAKVSLKSTVKKTRTTISKVYVEPTAKSSKGTTCVNVKFANCNPKPIQGDNSQIAAKSRALTMTNSIFGPPTPDLKPRKKWSTNKQVTLAN